MDEKTLLWITAMINNFPQSKNTNMKLALFGFEAVLEGLSNAAIIDTAKAYMSGRIEGQDLAFAPSSAQFAVEARKRDWELKPKPIMIEAPGERKLNPEYSEQMSARLKMLSCAMQRDKVEAFQRWCRRFQKPIKVPMYLDEAVN